MRQLVLWFQNFFGKDTIIYTALLFHDWTRQQNIISIYKSLTYTEQKMYHNVSFNEKKGTSYNTLTKETSYAVKSFFSFFKTDFIYLFWKSELESFIWWCTSQLLQQPMLAIAGRSQAVLWVKRGPRTWVIFLCFSQASCRKQDRKWSSRDTNQCSKRLQHHTKQLNQ